MKVKQPERMNAMNAFFRSPIENRWVDDDGYLHITLSFMRTGLLEYEPTKENFPNGIPADAISDNGNVIVYVDEAELSDPDSLKSLQGKDILLDHEMIQPWTNKADMPDIVATVAGVPYYEDGLVKGEAIVKNKMVQDRLDKDTGDLKETSSGYFLDLDWTPGIYNGTRYAAMQRNIRYNHAVFLPEGEGRCGPTVGVMNAKGKTMADEKVPFWSRVFGRKVYAQNERDAEEIMKEEIKLSNMSVGQDGNRTVTAGNPANYRRNARTITGMAENESEEERRLIAELEPRKRNGEFADNDIEHEEMEIRQGNERIDIIQRLKEELIAERGRSEELQAKLNQLQESLQEGKYEDEKEIELERMQEEREDAADMLNNYGIVSSRTDALNSFKKERLHGRRLKVHVMNSIRTKSGRDHLSEEQAGNDIAVNAMWDVIKDIKPLKNVAVGSPFDVGVAMNSKEQKKAIQNDNLRRLGYKTKEGN